jgi:hypothetical protein
VAWAWLAGEGIPAIGYFTELRALNWKIDGRVSEHACALYQGNEMNRVNRLITAPSKPRLDVKLNQLPGRMRAVIKSFGITG